MCLVVLGMTLDLRDITLGADKAFSAMKAGSLFVDHTTTSSDVAVEVNNKALEKNIYFLDAPVSGGEVGAIKGELTVMIGGENAIFEKVKPIIKAYAKKMTLIGGPGKGQVAKMVNQICIAGLVQALSEAISFSEKNGLDTKKVLQAISGGAAEAGNSLTGERPWLIVNRFRFYKVNEKDLNICLSMQTMETFHCR